jgi:hypothetical protein
VVKGGDLAEEAEPHSTALGLEVRIPFQQSCDGSSLSLEIVKRLEQSDEQGPMVELCL